MAAPGELRVRPTKGFDRDLKRLTKRGKDMDKIRDVVERIRTGTGLERRHRDHALVGDWQGWRDCHIESDWLLVYRVDEGELILGRTGTHSDIFS